MCQILNKKESEYDELAGRFQLPFSFLSEDSAESESCPFFLLKRPIVRSMRDPENEILCYVLCMCKQLIIVCPLLEYIQIRHPGLKHHSTLGMILFGECANFKYKVLIYQMLVEV